MTKMDQGFKLINFMSFGESVFLAGFNQKTTEEDLFVKGNYGNLPHN
jgi:hypothetical protein